MPEKIPLFSSKTLRFLETAGRQKRPRWLERHRNDYETCVLLPLGHLARSLAAELRPLAPDYHFPLKGIGRIKRPSHRVTEHGGGLYKSWMTYQASRPRVSRFETNPNLYFMIDTDDPKDTVLVAGGLYVPSSRQLRSLREAIAKDASAFDELFADRAFARCFPGGFSSDRIATRPPRGFDPAHPRMSWLKLQAFFVWKPYSRREFASRDFSAIVSRDWKQILRLNRLLEKALQGRLPINASGARAGGSKLLDRLEGVQATAREMDF